MSATRRRAIYGRIYAIPAVLAAVSLVGLISALVGDGFADLVSWLALGAVIGTIVWAWIARRG